MNLISHKEFKIQKALGLIHTYEGYVKQEGAKHYSVFQVDAFSYKHAKALLNNICRVRKRRTGKRYFIEFIYIIER